MDFHNDCSSPSPSPSPLKQALLQHVRKQTSIDNQTQTEKAVTVNLHMSDLEQQTTKTTENIDSVEEEIEDFTETEVGHRQEPPEDYEEDSIEDDFNASVQDSVLDVVIEEDEDSIPDLDKDLENANLAAISKEEFEMIEQVCAELDKKDSKMQDMVTEISLKKTSIDLVKKVLDEITENERERIDIVNGDVDVENGGEQNINGIDEETVVARVNERKTIETVENAKTADNIHVNSIEMHSDTVSNISEISSTDSSTITKPKSKSALPIPVHTHHREAKVRSPEEIEIPAKSGEKMGDHLHQNGGNKHRSGDNGTWKTYSSRSSAKEITHNCVNKPQQLEQSGKEITHKSAINKPVKLERRRGSSGGNDDPEPLRKRSASVADVGNVKDLPVRENAASRKRIGALKTEPEPEPDYLTPLQRKDVIIKDLKAELADAQRLSDARAVSIEVEMDGHRLIYEEKLLEKEDLITKLDQTLRELDLRHQTVISEQVQLQRHLAQLTKEHEDLKDEMEKRENIHRERYLDMYNKGRDSARFERRDELEALVESGTEKVSVAELLEKVKLTEQELEWWQSAKRNELYKETILPETSADATLRFLRDSMYHYLMKGPDADQHMQAIISIFRYTDTQLKNIKRLEKKKRKSTS